MRVRNRNPHISYRKEPFTREDITDLRNYLDRLWEDTRIQTAGGVFIINAGNLKEILNTLLDCKDFDNPQLMMGETPK